MNQLSQRFRLKVVLATAASLALVGYIDVVTGYELRVFAFYFIPVSLCAWYLGRFSVLCTATISAVCWFFADLLSDHHYIHEWYRYWNGFISLVSFAIVGFVLHGLRDNLHKQLEARQELSKALEELRRSTEEIQELQNQLQVVCAWTKRIQIDGKWIPIDEFLTRKLHLKLTHGISPEASQEFQENAEEKKGPPTA